MRLAFVPVLLVLTATAYGCAPKAPPQDVAAAPASVSGTDRQGHFAQSASNMSTCVAMGAHTAHPELEFDLNVTPPETLAAKKYRSDQTNIWVAEFHEAGGNATDVALRNGTASPADLDEVWRIVQHCAG